MKLDINEVNHQYILRMVIFSIFLFRRQIRNPDSYKKSINTYLEKRLPWKINIKINTGDKLSRELERDLILDKILNGVENDFLNFVEVSFKTPLKNINLKIDLREEDKYQKFLYS